MRWQVPAHRQAPDWVMWLLAPIWGPALAIAAVVVSALWCKRWLMGPTAGWRPWFAWFPVELPRNEDQWPFREEKVWFEWIERRAGHLLGDAQYRQTPALAAEAQRAETGTGSVHEDAARRETPDLDAPPSRGEG